MAIVTLQDLLSLYSLAHNSTLLLQHFFVAEPEELTGFISIVDEGGAIDLSPGSLSNNISDMLMAFLSQILALFLGIALAFHSVGYINIYSNNPRW